MMLLSKFFFWLSAGLGTLSSSASRWEDLMGGGVGGRVVVLEESKRLSKRDLCSVTAKMCLLC